MSNEMVTYVPAKKATAKKVSTAGRKSNVERLEIRHNEELTARRLEDERAKDARRREQEAKRANPIQVDQRVVLVGWIASVLVAFSAAAILSFNGITSIATFIGLSFDWMRFLIFGTVEFMYLVFLVAYLLLRSRGERTIGVQVGMWFFAGVGIGGNFFHTLKYQGYDWTKPELWVGLVLSIAAPIAVVSLSKLASRVVFAKPE